MYFPFWVILVNPGPRKRNNYYDFSICHWNLNNKAAHNFEKVELLEACDTLNKFDIICLSERYLNNSVLSDNDNLIIKSYKLVRDDHLYDVKRGRVCA